jgi:preprotein translocase subunit SecB
MLYVEAPRQLFPFARAIVAECVRDGGFPPLLIHPVDFMELFQQRAAQQAETSTDQPDAPESSGAAAPNGGGEQKFEFEL